eukprot:3732321-Prorocentrum_lima.AAC.1
MALGCCPIVHVDILIFITAYYALPIPPFTFMAVLVHDSVWESDIYHALQALTTAFCGIGLSPILQQRNTSMYLVVSILTVLTCAMIGPRCM